MEFWIEYGYYGLFLASFLAATILPLGSEVLFTLMIVQGFDGVNCVVVAGLGNSIGGLTSYYLGFISKWKWLEKWFGIKQVQLNKMHIQIEKFGLLAAFFCWLPVVGDLIAVTFGVLRINLLKFGVLMFAGKFFRYGFLLYSLKYLIQ